MPDASARVRAGPSSASARPGGHGVIPRLLVALPDRAVMVLFWVCLVVSCAVLAGQFRPVVVLPAIAVLLAATWRLVPGRLPGTRSSALGASAAVALSGVWAVVNAPYVAEYVLVTRDPGFLTLEAMWLSGHPAAPLPMGAAEGVADAVPDVDATTGAYDARGGALNAQGAKLVPGLLALAGWAGGDRGVLVGNLVVGAIALLAVYGLARRLVGPWWALVPVVALGLSLPMLVFSRAAYTEPLNVVLVFGALTLSWSAFETRSWWRHLLAGALIGSTALARIDGTASVIGFVAGMGVVAGATLLPRARRRARTALLASGTSALVLVALGWLDLRLLSPGYLHALGGQFSMLVAALATTVAAATLVSLPRLWDPVRRFVLRRRRGLAVAGVVAVAVVAVVLSTRFLWLPGYALDPDSSYAGLVAGLQAREGMPVEPTRSYDDWSVRWLSWYYGWAAIVLAFAGLALVTHRAIVRRDPRLFMVLAVIAAPSALYLWRISITPDQVWAMRRLLPVTLPGFLVAGTVVLHALWQTRRAWARASAALLASVVVLFPLTTWSELVTTPEQGGRLGEIKDVCAALPTDKVAYLRPQGPPYLATLRSVCDVEVVQVHDVPTQEKLATIVEEWGGDVTFVGFDLDDLPLPWRGGAVPAPFRSAETTTWSYSLGAIPTEPVVTRSDVWIGTLDEDGTIAPVPRRDR